MVDEQQARESLVAALTLLAEHGLPHDMSEVLVWGNPRLQCPPGALAKVLAANREQALREAAEKVQQIGVNQSQQNFAGLNIARLAILSLIAKEPVG
ncbi:hypothetical protein [Sphingomonas hengshuiensis]|uniref:Uncharacterized protein n=1 Tax=Sphingomonas hengshuiensis TaxID=1609977 RepID=A0A7U4LF93_9SPHN|nr:hypothetical protein [Sphingomonas hengshuiensis]AJP72294.1 hypothetical protein TS85_11600 [Sphingomonas hengshuiensis]